MKGPLEGLTGERLRELKAARAATLALVAPLAQAQLDFSPRAGRWSIGEVADHLRLSEQVWRGEMMRVVALARDGRPAHVTRSFGELNVAPL
ncbi:MAG TPA: DinB family protein, partial [Vicinamibacterales bacterium]|nr:DinB family protein [Vicinamibacterales bacterium]